MNIPVTAITAGLLALILLPLSIRIVKLRRSKRVSLGDGGHEELRRAIRGHGNFTEYAPIGILLLLIAELQSVHPVLLMVLAVILLAGRAMHAYAFAMTTGNISLRGLGMRLTFIAIVMLALTNIVMPFIRLFG